MILKNNSIHSVHQAEEVLAAQFSLDYCCSVQEVLDRKNHFAVYSPLNGSRQKGEVGSSFLKIAVINGKLLCTGQKDVLEEIEQAAGSMKGPWFMEPGPLKKVHQIIKPYGYEIGQIPPFYVPFSSKPILPLEMELKWYEEGELLSFRGDERFQEALAFSETSPDKLAVVAIQNGEILGMAGASEDGVFLWQLGIDVIPEARGRGIGTYLVSQLKNEVMDRGPLPFYGTALSHIASQRIAIKAGFLPTWVELTARKM